MKTMTIGKRISVACAALVVLTVILGAVSIWNVARINTQVNLLSTEALPGTVSAGRLSTLIMQQRLLILRHMLMDNPEQMSQAEADLATGTSQIRDEMKTYERTITNPSGRQLFEKLAAPYEQLLRGWAKVQPLSRALKTKEAFDLWNVEGAAAAKALGQTAQDLVDLNKRQGDAYLAAANESGASARLWALIILGGSLISGGLLAYFIVRGINKVLKQAAAELSEGAEQVSSASGQVAGSSQSLAQGASEQAASLEETSASSEEMASMTRKNAANSQQAAQHMNVVSQRVVEANRTLDGMLTSMQEIGASSNKISRIIKVIDEIAFQTNILALNAAVEAARAGEAGLGFAVVADEVRNLAQRSAQAAKDTATLIEESILKSTEGSARLGEVAASIHAITEGANQVRTLVDEVDASSKEQAQGIEQISKAVAQMDEVTQRTAASAEESASASEELNAQSQALMAVVQQLQALVGASSVASRRSSVTKPSSATSMARSTPRFRTAKTAPRNVSLVGVPPHRGTDFPLDDSEFREF